MNKYDKLIEFLEKNEQRTVTMTFGIKYNNVRCSGVLMPIVIQNNYLMLNINDLGVTVRLEDIISCNIEEEESEIVIDIETNDGLIIALLFSEE